MTADGRILIIGGGPAGAACGIALAGRGLTVEIAEKASFPRAKVCGCCIGGSGIETLGRLQAFAQNACNEPIASIQDWVLETGVPIGKWKAWLDARDVQLPLPDGIAISRQAFDTQLIDVAESAGVHIMCETQARINELPVQAGQLADVQLRTQDKTTDRQYDAVVFAAGLKATDCQKFLPWTDPPHGPFGVSTTIPNQGADKGVIYMVCNQDGYVGLVVLEDGMVDIAGALRGGAGAAKAGLPWQRVQAILATSEFANWDLSKPTRIMTTPKLRRSRVAGTGRFLAIGDSAGYVEPFTGEGMTWAMKSGIAAADLIASQAKQLDQVGNLWAKSATGLLKSQKRTCRVITSALNWTPTRRLMRFGLQSMPLIAKPLVARLSR